MRQSSKRGSVLEALSFQGGIEPRKRFRLWSALEQMPGLSALAAEWHELMGEEWESVKPLFQVANRLADSFPCQSPHRCECVHGVTDSGKGRYVSFCRCTPKRCADLPVDRSELLIYQLDWSRLATAICDSLELTPGFLWDAEIPNTAIVGRYSPAAGHDFMTVLIIASEASELRQRIDTLISRLEEPFVLVLPTRGHCEPSIVARIKQSGSFLLPLDEILRADSNGRFSSVLSPSETLLPFARIHVRSLSKESGEDRPYVPPGTRWNQITICFTNGFDVVIDINGTKHETDLKKMGLARREGGTLVPSELGSMLENLVRENGYFTASGKRNRDAEKRTYHRLKGKLIDYLRIPGDPISPLANFAGWKANFLPGTTRWVKAEHVPGPEPTSDPKSRR